MKIRPPQPADRHEWLRMRALLWSGCSHQQLAEEIDDYCNGRADGAVFVAERKDGTLGGMIELALRPLAAGCDGRWPIAYVEGWFVDDDLRRVGVGRELMRAAENWAREQGCREIASDCLEENDVSVLAHRANGFESYETLMHFRKDLDAPALDDREQRSEHTWIALYATPLDASSAIRFVTDARAGGIDVFLGTTREEQSDNQRELLALDYEAYPEMALEQMKHLAEKTRSRWPVIKLALLHRTGRVGLGQPSVVIAVSTPHRAQAFEASRFLIDALKRDVPIWKKEIWSDGAASWVEGAERVKDE